MKKYRGVFIKNDREIDLLRKANGRVAVILDEIVARVVPGVPTMLFEEIARTMCRDMGVRPSFLGYNGFPFALCCSVNETVVHGFPSRDRILQEGDLISFDMGVVYEGFHGDATRTVEVGNVTAQARHLSRVTEECLHLGIAAAHPGNDVVDISAAIQRHAVEEGLHVIRRFVGHGVGANLHEKPEIPNFVLPGRTGVPLKVGMTLAIEPMLAIGTADVEIMADNWTANTVDRSLAAHWEHSVVITPDGAEILSLSANF